MKKTIQLISFLSCLALGGNIVYASTANWVGGSGNWTSVTPTVPGWTNADATYPDGIGQGANITVNAGGIRDITLDIPVTVGTVGLYSGGTGDSRVSNIQGTGTLTLDNGANKPTIVSATGNMGTNSVCVNIAGINGLRAPVSGGKIALAAANTYTGDTEVYRRILGIRNVDALPYGSRAGNVILITAGNPGDVANLQFDGLDSATINGLSSDTNNASSGTVPLVDGVNAPSGTFTLSVGDNDQGGIYDGNINDGLNSDGVTPTVVALTKIGGGTLTLNAVNSYSGATTVNGGTLAVNGSIASAVTVNNTGTLGGTGTVNGLVTVTAGGKIGPGNSAGILTLAASPAGLDMSAPNTTYVWELAANSTATPGTDFDQIVLTAGSADVTDANLNIQFIGTATAPDGTGFWASDHSWLIISASSVTGNFKNIQNGTNAAGSFYTTVGASGVTLNFKTSGVVPTPKPIITSVTGAGTASVTVNYTNTVSGKSYTLQYNTNLNTANWYNAGTRVAAGFTDSQTDATAILGEKQRYYRVFTP